MLSVSSKHMENFDGLLLVSQFFLFVFYVQFGNFCDGLLWISRILFVFCVELGFMLDG